METLNEKKPFYISYGLIIINIIVFIFMSLSDPNNGILNIIKFGCKVNYLIADGEYFRLLTPMFLHADIMHLLFNSMALFQIGPDIERIFGKPRFLAIYFVSGIIASLGTVLLDDSFGVGASGAIFGLIGANLFLFTFNREQYKLVYGTSMFSVVAINLFLGFTSQTISNTAHITGMIGGFLTCWTMIKSPNIKKPVLIQALAGITLIMFSSFVLFVSIPQYKNTESYYYYKGVVNIMQGNQEAGTKILIEGYDKFQSERIKALFDPANSSD